MVVVDIYLYKTMQYLITKQSILKLMADSLRSPFHQSTAQKYNVQCIWPMNLMLYYVKPWTVLKLQNLLHYGGQNIEQKIVFEDNINKSWTK